MARIHPSVPIHPLLSAGAYRERIVLQLLQQGLADNFDVFHNINWSTVHADQQSFGEYDFVVVSPEGHILILEIKSGPVTDADDALTKNYGFSGTKDIGHQMRRLHSSLLERIKHGSLPKVYVGALLVLPDAQVRSEIVAYPREQIVDASQYDNLCRAIQMAFPSISLPDDQRKRVIAFLSNRFEVKPDVATHVGQVEQTTLLLSSGLSTWVPRITHSDNFFQIEATAGSGKTQLALSLLRTAAQSGVRARYVCFNRPLADNLAKLAPPACEITTFHQLCRDNAELGGASIDFSNPKVFENITQQFINDAPKMPARLGLLILDEAQDMDPTWVDALSQTLLPDGKLYVMGDRQQQLYNREIFELPSAVQIRCMDNFRSPRRVVHVINQLKLISDPVLPRSAHLGEVPNFYVWETGKTSAKGQLETCLQTLWESGYSPSQVAVISYRGHQYSEVLKQELLAGYSTKRFRGTYDTSGNPLWSDGDLLVESLYRFKGQNATAIVLCEVDFEEFNEREKRKLFVGLTRAQIRVDIVLSQRAALALSDYLA
jgi:hypothetical protein